MPSDTPDADSRACLTCQHWQPKKSGDMAKFRLCRCALQPAWLFLPPQQTCPRHALVAADVAAKRVEWVRKG
jgi:hypothetical protein